LKDNCPESHPIKGNHAGRQVERLVNPIYHVPGGRWYAVADPEECFATVEDAEEAGYRAPLR
jgi:micrococcal nuclease